MNDSVISLGQINGTTSTELIIDNLDPKKVYFFCGYVMDNETPVYSLNTISTSDILIVYTDTTTYINSNSVTLCAILPKNCFTTEVYFEYGTTTEYGAKIKANQNPLGAFSLSEVNSRVNGLSENAKYNFRAIAVANGDTVKSENKVFQTLTKEISTVIDIDDNIYNTIKIGNQEWLVENLKTTKFNDGTPIAAPSSPYDWQSNINGAFCWPKNDMTNYKKDYGALYNWPAIDGLSNGNKNICPVGWHVPTIDEWEILASYLGGPLIAGEKLKETGTDHWLYNYRCAINLTGFSALPGGYREGGNEYFNMMGEQCIFWSASALNDQSSWIMLLESSNIKFEKWPVLKDSGCSVRCVKD
ncbi:MAG: fibrobacter succinogenes major paralogous domain-containing protein [Bacteroidales bacterium]